jgi:hypothetical protein
LAIGIHEAGAPRERRAQEALYGFVIRQPGNHRYRSGVRRFKAKRLWNQSLRHLIGDLLRLLTGFVLRYHVVLPQGVKPGTRKQQSRQNNQRTLPEKMRPGGISPRAGMHLPT